MNILITGVAGLIGAKAADWLIQNKPEVTVIGIDDLSGGFKENVNPKVKLYIRNLVSDKLDDIPSRYEVKYAWCTHKKSEEILKYCQQTSLKEGISKMWLWAKNQPKRKTRSWKNYELNKGIYDLWKKS